MDSEVASRKIFIGGLSYGTDDDKLRQYFESFGAVQDAVVMKDPVSRRSRGFGFITFEHSSYVDNVLAQDVHTIDSRKVEAKRAVPRNEVPRESPPTKPSSSNNSSPAVISNSVNSAPTVSSGGSSDEFAYCKIFVGGLHYDTRDGEFRNYFEKYGKVLSAEVMFNRETHKSRGFGFIVFESESGVDNVCAVKEHVIDGKMVEVKRAVPRSKIGSNSSSNSGSGNGKGHTVSNSAKSGTSGVVKPASADSVRKPSLSGGNGLNPPASPQSSNTKPPTPSGSSSAAPGPASRRAAVGTASYAAALKSGASTTGTSAGDTSPRTIGSPGGTHTELDSSKSSPLVTGQQMPVQPLLQHQEQFPLPTSPIGTGPANRHRSHSESFLNMAQKPQHHFQHQQQQQSNVSFMGALGGPSLVGPMHQQQQQQPMQTPNQPMYYDNYGSHFQLPNLNQQQGHDSSRNAFGMPMQQASSAPDSGMWMGGGGDGVYRSDVERSSSLGGLGWMPSSFASSPPDTRRCLSDLGLNMGFGVDSGGLSQQSDSGDLHGLVPPPNPSAWASMVDVGSGFGGMQGNSGFQQQGQNQPPFGSPPQQSQHSLHEGSPFRAESSDVSRHSNALGGSGDFDYSGLSPQRTHSGSFGNSSSILGNDDDNEYNLQELRLQASEFVPNSSGNHSNPW
eukprot:CAMPEP_0185017442 /NCGR_PEP_ID=MMETSP1103-20130426/396_1 /TAXON_ID=36769 /ORGANISM="Paraphysomonas bandaiensis, Strain Caron Lab Isolate" /LENGTH=672 /DNA_ID=CAMNT_0027546861 /DNA_START=81 /DNA_END=2096 /DNA_ORIENTATION=+